MMTANQKGQAWYVLHGYRYQLLLSLDAWVGLGSDQILLLETEEDFSVDGPMGTVDAQVKSSAAAAGPKSHSLRSKDVRTALARFWARSSEGRDSRPQLAFIAQGGAAREQGLAFPDNVAGIDYWRAVVLGADTAPIRSALASIFNGEPIGEWINSNPSDEELRARLLTRVRWTLDALEEGPLTDLVREKVAELYLQKGLWVTLADEAIRSLLDRVFEAAAQADPKDRRLTAVDLHRSIEVAAGPALALQSVARNVGSPSAEASEGLLVSTVGPPGGNVTDRRETVSTILEQARGQPVIWLHGGHGVGKSTLARLIATQIGGSWLALDLRPVEDDAKAALTAWRELLHALQRTSGASGIVIDDFAGSAFDVLRPRLAALVGSAAPKGTRVLISSPQRPSAARLAELGASPNAAIRAPYFSEADVRTLVTTPLGPPSETIDGWTRLLLVTTNGGHPLLVAAKVASLRSRGWPLSALPEDIGPVPSEAVRATREEARRRLLDDIPSPEARALLRRLGTVFDRADDALVLKLARQDPQIANASDALALLRGSWIEVIPGNDLRLSPLISDIAHDLGQDESIRCRRTAAEHWLGTGVLNQRTLPLCFWNAFWGRHTTILMLVCQAVETLPPEHLRGAAALLSPMTIFRTDRPIYPEVPPVGAMLRLLQFEVANAVEDDDIAARVAETLLSEIENIDHEELRLLYASISIPKMLLAEHVNLSPATQLNWALRLRVVLKSIIAMDKPEFASATQWLHTGFPPGTDLPGFLFAVVVLRIRSSARMHALIEALNTLSDADRNNFLDAARISLGMGAGAFVHNGWAQEQLDSLDLRPALERFVQMSAIVQHWKRPDVQAEIENACSVILDEGLNDQTAALAMVDKAISALGHMPSLIRQKAKVLGHSGNDLAAAQLLISVEDTVGLDSPIDRALALRDGAVSAARASLFSDAIRLFQKAREVLLAEGQHPALAIGMQVEIALTSWEMNDRIGALSTVADALEAVEALDVSASRQNERAHQFARGTIGLFWHKIDAYPSETERRISIGQASALSGDEALLGVDLKPLAYNWRILALCEIELGIDVGVERRSLTKQAGESLASIELFIAMARYSRAIVSGEFTEAFRRALEALWAYRTAKKLREGDSEADQVCPSPVEALRILSQEGLGEIVKTVPVDLLIWHRFRGTWDAELISRVRAGCIAAWGDAASIADVIDAGTNCAASSTLSMTVALAASFAAMPDLKGNPRARYERDLLFVLHTAQSLARRLLEPVAVPVIAAGWSVVLENEGFALRSPMQHRPAIEAAISEMPRVGLKAAARLLLTAAPAVRAPLSQSWEQLLHQISSGSAED